METSAYFSHTSSYRGNVASARRVRDSLRSWRYCEIKVLAAEPRSQKRSGDEAFEILKY